ncbi:MAG: hypothetical protein WCD57_06805 [Acidobacteriaceae bacterium]
MPAEFYDLQKPYVEMWLRFIGVTSVESVIVEKTLFDPEVDNASRKQPFSQATSDFQWPRLRSCALP